MAASPIFAALDALGLQYDTRQSERGVPYAGFRLIRPSGEATSVTMIVEQGVCRLTAHGIAPAGRGPDAREAVRAGARLPLGAAYRSPDDGTLELAVGFWLGEGGEFARLEPSIAGQMLDYLADATRALVGAGAAPVRPAFSQPAAGVAALRKHLQSLGHVVDCSGDFTRFRVTFSDGAAGDVGLRETSDGWAEAVAGLVPAVGLGSDPRREETLQRLQRWTTAGRFVIAGDGNTLRAEVHTPYLGSALPSLTWSASQAAAMLWAAHRHLGAGSAPSHTP
jgi:hypothetical protein